MVTLINNCCFIIDTPAAAFLVDPFISKKLLNNLEYNYVLISHGHIDHCLHIDAIQCPIISNAEVAKRPEDIVLGNNPANIEDLTIFTLKTRHPRGFQNNFIYDYTYSLIGNRRLMRCGDSYGFILKYGNHSIYYSGDDILDRNKLFSIRKTYSLDLALISFQRFDWGMLNLLSPIRDVFKVEDNLGCPVLPVHLYNKWYLEHREIYFYQGVKILNVRNCDPS